MIPEQKNRLFILFTGHAAETLTAEEHAELQDALRSDAEARRLWFVHQDVEAGVRARAVSAPVVATAPRRQMVMRWHSWRPLVAAAAGIVIGLFSSSLVFSKSPYLSVLTLITESFEDEKMPVGRGVPTVTGLWSGNLTPPLGEKGAVKPANGLRMVALPPVEQRKFSYAFRFIDLSGLAPANVAQTRQIEITAKFQGQVKDERDRFQIRLAAFAEEAAEAREIWVTDQIADRALLHVSKSVKESPDEHGWTTARLMIEVPASARVALISLAARKASSTTTTEHYLDDVQVRLITQEPLP